jgi:hypothetical protein
MSEIKPIFTNEAMLTAAAVHGGTFIVSRKDGFKRQSRLSGPQHD